MLIIDEEQKFGVMDKEKIKKVSKKLNDKKLDVVIFSGDLIKKGDLLTKEALEYAKKNLSTKSIKQQRRSSSEAPSLNKKASY